MPIHPASLFPQYCLHHGLEDMMWVYEALSKEEVPQEADKSTKCTSVAGSFAQTGLEEAKSFVKSKADVPVSHLSEGDTDVLHGVCICYCQGMYYSEVGSDARRSFVFYDEHIACRLGRRGTLVHPHLQELLHGRHFQPLSPWRYYSDRAIEGERII